MIRVRRLVKISGVASRALRRCACITACMTVNTVRCKVRARQRETRHVVVKTIRCASGWVTGQTSRTVVRIPVYPVVAIVRFRVGVAGGTGEFSVVRRVGVAIHTGIPFAVVLSAVNREVLRIVVKSGGCPGTFRMTGGTIR